MNGKRAALTLREWAVVVANIGILVLLLLPAVGPDIDERGPLGAAAPEDIPRESQRFRAQDTGISITLPENWEFKPHNPWVHIYARNGGRRLKGQIIVAPMSPPSVQELQRCKLTRHGEWPAHELMVVTRHGTFDDPAYSTYARLVETPVGWFKIQYMIQSETTVLPDGVRRFLDTVRFPDKPVAKEFVFDVDLPSPPAR